MQASHFLHLFSNISPDAPNRRRRIRRAAYISMARAASPTTTWSHALLHRLRRRRRRTPTRRVRTAVSTRTITNALRSRRQGPSRADKLRRLVPGGKGMDMCNLLEETYSYVQCLSSQVKLMQAILDQYIPIK